MKLVVGRLGSWQQQQGAGCSWWPPFHFYPPCCKVISSCLLPLTAKQQVFQPRLLLLSPSVCVDPGMKLPSVSSAVRAQSSFVSIILCAENTIGKFVPRPSVKSGPHTLIVREASRTLQGKHRLLRFQKYVSVRLRL